MEDQKKIESEYNLRKKKRLSLISEGTNPYPANAKRTHTISEFLTNFNKIKSVFLCGRVRSKRGHGALIFLDLEDLSGLVQIVISRKDIPKKTYNLVSEVMDVGDIVEVSGIPFITQRKQNSLLVKRARLLTKTLRSLPSKWHGFEDQEERYRKRYLDFLINKSIRDLFFQKALFVKKIRNFLEKNGFTQFNMPVLEVIPGGADATPFITHHQTLDIDLFLRISIELFQKRMIVGGFEKIYDLGPVFRNEGMSREHLQEFTMLEFYWAFADYQILMDFTEKMYCEIIEEIFGTLSIIYNGNKLNFKPPWPKLDYIEIIKKETGIDLDQMNSNNELKTILKKQGIKFDIEKNAGLGRVIDKLYKKFVRPKIIQPTFLINHPVAISPLAKKHDKYPNRTQRFQIIVAGSEVGNGYSELNDPVDQYERFREQQRLRDAGDQEAQYLDEDFVEALEYGLPPTAGFGVGVDRLFMILANQKSIRDVVAFPIMKQKL